MLRLSVASTSHWSPHEGGERITQHHLEKAVIRSMQRCFELQQSNTRASTSRIGREKYAAQITEVEEPEWTMTVRLFRVRRPGDCLMVRPGKSDAYLRRRRRPERRAHLTAYLLPILRSLHTSRSHLPCRSRGRPHPDRPMIPFPPPAQLGGHHPPST